MPHPPQLKHIAHLGLGANLGDRHAHFNLAQQQLNQLPQSKLIAFSDIIQTDPVGGPPDQPPYLNAAASLQTQLTPTQLLTELRRIENLAGRERHQRWGPRTLDLDLLLYNQTTLQSESLTIPHPRMHQRRFVLQPLAQIAPEAHHPTLKKTIAQLLQELDD